MIAVMTESVLRSAADDGGPMVVLLRMVRERDGNIDSLVRDFERRTSERGTDLNARLALGHLYREAGRFDDALREYAVAERAAPTSPAPPRALADLYHRMDRATDERAARERSLARTTDRREQADTLRLLVELALTANDLPSARSYHQRLVAQDRQSLTIRRELADALLQRRMFAPAIEEYQSLVRSLSGDNRVLPPVLRDLGRAFAGANQHEQAIAAYRRALSVAGTDAGVRREIYSAMTDSFVAQNALPAWIAELEREPTGRDSYDRAVLLGRLHDQAGNATQAIRAYQRAIATRPTDLDAQRAIAQLYRRQGERDLEIAAYRRLVQLAPRETDWVIELADLLVNVGRREEALQMLADASRRAGDDASVHERLAEVYSRLGRRDESLRETELVVRLDPSSPVALAALGRQYMERDQRDRAMATWRRIVDGARDRGRAALALGNVYFDNGMLAEAEEMFREAVTRRPDDVEIRLRLAEVLERSRRFEQAIVEWREVLNRTQNDRGIRRAARQSIVRLWQLQGRLQSEIPRLQAAFLATPPNIEAGRDLAEVFGQLRQWPDAETTLRRVVTLEPGDVVALESLERALSQSGNDAGAIEVLQRLVQVEPRRGRDFFQRMAQHALALHRDADALEYATRAVQLNDQDATAHLRLAEMYRARGDEDSAIASLRRALELNDRLFPTYFELADLYLGHRNAARDAVALYRRVILLSTDDEYVIRAGRRAVQIAPAAGVGDELERDLAQASAAQPGREIFRRLLVSYFDNAARPLINRVKQGTAQEAASARAELLRMGARALAPLLDALGDQDPAQQRIALDILGYLGNPNASSALITKAESEEATADIRQSALLAAGALGDPRMLHRLQTLVETSDRALGTIAVWGIAHIRSRAATDALIRIADEAGNESTRTMAVLGLSATHDTRARAVLRRIAENNSIGVVLRAAAVVSLGASIERGGEAMLLSSLQASPMLLRAASASALGSVGAGLTGPAREALVLPLARALFMPDEGRVSVRRVAARSLIALAGAATDSSARAFDDPSYARSSTEMLQAMLDPSDKPLDGSAVLQAWAPTLTLAAREALRNLNEGMLVVLGALVQGNSFAPLLDGHLGQSASAQTVAVLDAIVRELAPEVAQLVRHTQSSVRRAAVTILARAGEAGVAGLVAALADDDENVAIKAVDGLRAHVRLPAVTTALVQRLSTESAWPLRAAVAEALGSVADGPALSALAQVLQNDAFAYVRVAAARSLRRSGTQQAELLAALQRASQTDPDPSVRRAALGQE
jgi:tetratricopeptide (TPR) repeat protein